MDFLFNFSRSYCIAICSFLVPTSLLLTLWILLLVGWQRPSSQMHLPVILANLVALTLLLHDFTWFSMGVVMAPTYILFTLASVCLSLNIWAIAHPLSMEQQIKKLCQYGMKNIAMLTNHTFYLRVTDRN